MGWGNIKINEIEQVDGVVLKINATFNSSGDYRKTKKLGWLAKTDKPEFALTNLILADFDYLINKPKPEEDDKLEDIVTEKTEFLVNLIYID